MSYATFIAVFLLLPLAGVLLFLGEHLRDRRLWILLGLLVTIALSYMVPWDHQAVVWGFWTWNPQQTWQQTIWGIPLEEYLFCILETILATTLLFAVLVARRERQTKRDEEPQL